MISFPSKSFVIAHQFFRTYLLVKSNDRRADCTLNYVPTLIYVSKARTKPSCKELTSLSVLKIKAFTLFVTHIFRQKRKDRCCGHLLVFDLLCKHSFVAVRIFVNETTRVPIFILYSASAVVFFDPETLD